MELPPFKENRATSAKNLNMSFVPRPGLLRYGGALVAIALATLVRSGLNPALGTLAPFVTFLVATMITARYLGFGPALLALGLGGISAAWFFIPPYHSLELQGPAGLTQLGLYIFIGLTHSFLCESLRGAERRA